MAVRAIRRALRIFDPLLSRLELRATGLDLRSSISHDQRLVLTVLAGALRDPGTVVYDIGAASGEFSCAFASVSTVDQVIAFEPLADSYDALVTRTHDLANVRTFRLALGDEPAVLGLNRSAWRNTSSFLAVNDLMRRNFPLAAQLEAVENVEVARLDDVVRQHELPPPDVVKIDVQGFEDRVIRGGRRTLRGARACVVETSLRPMYDGSPLFDDVYGCMRDLDFVLTGFAGSLGTSEGELLQVDAVFEPQAA